MLFLNGFRVFCKKQNLAHHDLNTRSSNELILNCFLSARCQSLAPQSQFDLRGILNLKIRTCTFVRALLLQKKVMICKQ